MKNDEYWHDRFIELQKRQLAKGEEYYKDMERQYRLAIKGIEDDIARWYIRFAGNNEVSVSMAKKMLKAGELEEFKWTVDEFIRYGKQNTVTSRWMKELENASARVHISRLEALKLQVRQRVEVLYATRDADMKGIAKDIFEEGYYRSAYEIQKGLEVAWVIEELNHDLIDRVISKPWAVDGKNFSERIWQDREKLVNILHNEMTQAFIRGDAPDKMIKNIAKKMNVSKGAAGRLVMTESAYFNAASKKQCYDDLDVEKYRISATLDMLTSELCQSMDGLIFEEKDYEPGVTAEPFHPNCRTTTIPYFPGNVKARVATGLDGKSYSVPGDMTYSEWKKNFVGEENYQRFRKMHKNVLPDKALHAKYRTVFGDEIPKSFSKFQELKYDEPAKWGKIKERKQGTLNSLDYKDSFKEKFGNQEVRGWYKAHCDDIPNRINLAGNFEEQALEAFELRNTYKFQAREMMKDVEKRFELDRDHPIPTLEGLIKRKIDNYGMTRDEAIKNIVDTAAKTNNIVNAKFGLE